MPGKMPRIYECEVIGVKPEDRLLSARSLYTGRKFTDVSYMLPYINALGGGVDAVPRTGDRCVILSCDREAFSSGTYSLCIGFRVPPKFGYQGLELGGRLADMGPGSVALRAVDELGNDAYVACFSGGTVLIGSGQAARTVYSPINSTIAHLFDNWEQIASGGFVRWARDTGSDDVLFEAEYRTKSAEETEGKRVRVKIGVESDPVVVEVVDGPGDHPNPPLRLRVDSNGEVFIEGHVINIHGLAAVDIDAPNVTIKGKPVLGERDPI